MGYLIDTCIWVGVERGKISPADVEVYTGKESVFISPVTIAELTYGIEISKKKDIKNKRIAALQKLKKKPLLIIDDITGEIFGKIAIELFKTKRESRFRIQDIWLASQAIQHSFKLLTYNIKDFADIPGLQLEEFGK